MTPYLLLGWKIIEDIRIFDYRNIILRQSARVFSFGYSLNIK